MKKKVLSILLAGLMALSLAACGGGSASAPAEDKKEEAPAEEAAAEEPAAEEPAAEAAEGEAWTMRLATNHTEDFVTSLALQKFAEDVEAKTGGAIKIEIYYNAVLGEEKATIEQAQFGGIDIIRVSMSPLSEFVDEFNALQFPYVFANKDHYWKVMDSEEVGKALLWGEEMQAAGLYGLCYYDNGTRNFFFSKATVHTPADMAKMNIRVQESALMMGMVTAMGANPVPMTSSEIYSSLQTGVIDGAENNLPWYLSMSLNEVAPNITMDEHNRAADMLAMSKQTWDKLTPEQQQIFQECADASSLYQRELWAQSELDARNECIEKGCTITDLTPEEMQQFMDAVKELNASEGSKYADIFAKIEEMQ